ncbi:SGNH/GDSL hydrolase family protein [Maribacter algicola]|uniref:SGNH/GDSL hydrolase family protein n=1 Tax=Meishania litoralis TaxID=3434685 RepID=A0ACC7LPB7_9FLAO
MKQKLLLICCLIVIKGCSQEVAVKWWNPQESAFNVLEGQVWPAEVEDFYDRLPKRAKENVREPVWNLSKHASGLKIRFRSNAEEIIVRYGVGLRKAMDHMPATGVSGVDLYAKDSDGEWLWCNGGRTFSDTITFKFNGLRSNDKYHDLGREYRLNLPLYNTVEWMEIGIPESAHFEPLPVRKEKPIVVYGTSIAHGACASRPGMAWTNILSRKMDRPLINLAFSGNGRLEKELIDLVDEIDAKIYILDCLPNLWREETYDDAELEKRIVYSVRQLRKERPETPILLVDHAGYTDGFIRDERKDAFSRVNRIQRATYKKLQSEGITGLHYLSYEELGLRIDDTVDGTHPNDLGMIHYAEAYETKLREILNEPTGNTSTTLPVTQYREPNNYDWEKRHNEILEMNKNNPPKKVILANSIVHFWGGLPRSKLVREETTWEKYLTPLGARNYAYGWDRIENVLWRVYHGELDGFKAEQVLVMIGTNNLHLNTDEEITTGLKLLMQAVEIRQPDAEIVLMGILPRRDQEERVKTLNQKIERLAKELGINYAYVGDVFLKSDEKIDESLFSDGLHPNKKGYLKMRSALLPIISL